MALNNNFKGAILMTFAMAGFGVNDALVKSVTTELSTGQIIFLRGAISTALVFVIALKFGALRPFRTIWSPMLVLRLVAELLASLAYIYALGKIPLANAGAILQFLPLAVTLGAALFLKEPVGWRRWGAIVAGFIGVLLIIRPGPEGFSVASLLAFFCVLAAAARDLATKQLAKGIPSLYVTFVTSAVISISGGALIEPLGGWQPLTFSAFGRLALAACFLLIGYQSLIIAMREGEISFIAPFRYTYLIWATILGYMAFGDIPDAYMAAGAIIVIASGIYTFYRENYRRTSPVAQSSEPRPPN